MKKGASTVTIEDVTIAEDKKSAVITLGAKLSAGEYTVAVKSGEETLSKKLTAEDEKIDKIEILSDQAPVNDDITKATVGVKVSNQYGEDVTKTTISSLGKSVNVGSVNLDAKGIATITLPSNSKAGDKVTLTLIDPATGTSTSKTITLSDKSAASEVEVGALYNKDGKQLTTDTDLSKDKFYLPVTVKDQYGNAITDTAKAKAGLTITNTNPSVAKFVEASSKIDVVTIEVDGKETLALQLDNILSAGTTNALVIANATGKNAKGTVEVAKGVEFASIGLSKPEGTISASKDYYFPLAIEDTTGKSITTQKELDTIKNDGLNVTLSTGTGTIEEVEGKGLFVKVPAASVVKDTPLTVTVTSTGSLKNATQTVTPVAKAEAKQIIGLSDKAATAVREGKTVTIKNTDLVVEDQYGQKLTTEELKTIFFKAEDGITLANIANNAKLFSVAQTPSTNGGPVAYTSYDITANGSATVNTDKITFSLVTGAGLAIANTNSFSKTFTKVSNASINDATTYEVKEINPIYVKRTNVDTYTGVEAAYKQNFVVTATTKDGQVITLDRDEYNVTEKSSNVDLNATTKEIDVENSSLKDTDFKDGVATKSITVTINATGKTVTKEFQISSVAPVAEKVQYVDSGDNTKEVTKVTTATLSNFNLTPTQIVVTDQYKASNDDLASNATVTFEKVAGTVTFEANGTKTAKVASATAGSVVKATIKSGSKTFVVEITFTTGA